MSVKERLTQFIKFKKISVRSFERSVGLSYGYVNNMRVSIQPDKVENIARYYPDLNTGWLLTGEGEMLKQQLSVSSHIFSESGKYNMPGSNVTIPYYDIEISAGTVNFFNDYPELPNTKLSIPFVSGVELAMPVYGDSMYPKIKNGDIVLLHEIHDKSVIMFGEIYLVITDDYRTLKYIRKGPSDDKILLVSENDRYDPVVIALDNVIKLFLYKGKFEKSQI